MIWRRLSPSAFVKYGLFSGSEHVKHKQSNKFSTISSSSIVGGLIFLYNYIQKMIQ
jgi:hypothetical protein